MTALIEGKYEVIAKIKEGGMGAIYKVRHVLLDEVRVIKVMRSQIEDDSEAQRRFLQEAKLATSLKHPNVATFIDFAQDRDHTFYMVMEFIEGVNLAEFVAENGTPPIPATLEIGIQTLAALGYLHKSGVVHRDISPDNMMLAKDANGRAVVKLIDLGVAKQTDSREGMTLTGAFVGKLKYASPEQLGALESGESIDGRSDIYSLGCVLYQTLSGQPPFGAEATLQAYLKHHLMSPPRSFEETDPEGRIPADVRAAVLKAMAKSRGERWATAEEFAEVLIAARDRMTGASVSSEIMRSITDGVARMAALKAPSENAGDIPRAREPLAGDVGVSETRAGSTAVWSDPPYATTPPPRVDATVPSTTTPVPRGTPGVDEDLSGRPIGRFALHELVAHGRTGPFYKAYDPVRGELIGLKLVGARDADTRRRLLRAGRIWLELKHPNLVTVFEVHPDYGGYTGVIASELVVGESLAHLRERPQPTVEQIVSIGVQLCEALAYMHARGVIHREVRPHNILVTVPEYRVKLLDSGIARHANPEIDAFTKTGVVVGDLSYASPELARGRVDQRVDLYAVGAILHELLTGQRLDSLGSWPSRLRLDSVASIPAALRTVVERALHPEPDRRFGSTQELAEALRAVVPGESRPPSLLPVVVTLHGIRTHAGWQRSFAEVATSAGLESHLDRWNFGYFSSIRFLLPWSRLAKVRWFRTTYETEFPTRFDSLERPSVIAHSFGTYILGNALLRYPYLRFRKVLLCGSILPTTFPWDALIERGQVQAVRNEYGTEDVWTKLVAWFVPGTGPSGIVGFRSEHARFEQKRYTFSHSEYFERGHMASQWVPFLKRRLDVLPPQDLRVSPPKSEQRPWGLYVLYAATLASVGALIRALVR